MKTNERERLLLIVVVAAIVPVVAAVLFFKITGSFEAREIRIKQLVKEQHTHKMNIAKATMATKRLKAYQQQALSSDALTARASLESWLAATAEEIFIPETVLVKPVGNRPLRDDTSKQEIGEQITFRVSARGDLQQLTSFLHRFYTANSLSRIATLSVNPRDDSKLLDVVLLVDALSLMTASEGEDSESALSEGSDQIAIATVMSASATTPFASVACALYPANAESSQRTMVANKLWRDILSNETPERFAYADNSYSDYADPILTRNLFGEVNRRPEIASFRTGTGTTERTHSLSIKASDPDKFDQLSFKFVGEPPYGAELRQASNGRSATISFTPPKAGDYEFTVAVADDGFPSKQAERTFVVAVADPRPERPRDPPKPPEKFDFAKYTEVQAFLRGRDGIWEVWIHVKPRDKAPLELRVGDQFDIGSVKGRVQDIGPRSVILEVNGEPREFGRGEVLTAGSPPPEV